MDPVPPWQRSLRFLSIGTEFILTFGLVLVGGLLLDRRWDTAPVFTLIGAIGGFALGMYRLVVEARKAQRELEKKARQDTPGDTDDRKDKDH